MVYRYETNAKKRKNFMVCLYFPDCTHRCSQLRFDCIPNQKDCGRHLTGWGIRPLLVRTVCFVHIGRSVTGNFAAEDHVHSV